MMCEECERMILSSTDNVSIPINEYKRLLKTEERMSLLVAAITDDIRKTGDCWHVYQQSLRLLTGTMGIEKEENDE